MGEKTVQDTPSHSEEGLSRRSFVKYGLGVGKAVFIGGLLVGNFAGCTTASKKDSETKVGRKTNIKFAHITDTHVTFTGKNGTALFEESFDIFRDIIAQVNEMDDIDFILFGGDNINNTDPGTKGFDEFMNIMEGINVCHAVLLVERMTFAGSISSITRYTMKKDENGPFGKASFEETMDNFLNAAAKGEIEPTESVSASIVCGKRACIGTGLSNLKINLDLLENI